MSEGVGDVRSFLLSFFPSFFVQKKSFWNPRFGPSIVTQEMPIHITNVALLDPVVK